MVCFVFLPGFGEFDLLQAIKHGLHPLVIYKVFRKLPQSFHFSGLCIQLLFQAVCGGTKVADMSFQSGNVRDAVVKQILAQLAVLFQIVRLCPLGICSGIALIEIGLE